MCRKCWERGRFHAFAGWNARNRGQIRRVVVDSKQYAKWTAATESVERKSKEVIAPLTTHWEPELEAQIVAVDQKVAQDVAHSTRCKLKAVEFLLDDSY